MSGIYGTPAITLPLSWLVWLATSDLRLAVYAMRDLYGLVRVLHLVGMSTFVGMVVLLDLRGLGLFPPGALDLARSRLGAVLRVSFWVTVASGLVLFLRDPVGVGLHSMFLPKLLLVVFGYGFARWLRGSRALRGLWPRRGVGLRRGAAAVSLMVWLLVIAASTWNHVERPMRVGDALRLQNSGKE